MGQRKNYALSVNALLMLALALCVPSLNMRTANAKDSHVHVVQRFNPKKGEFAENLAVDAQDNIYVSLLQAGIVREFAPNGKQKTQLALPVGPGGSVTGLVVDEQNHLFVGVSSSDAMRVGVWQVNIEAGTSHRIAALPVAALPNGLSADSQGNLYVADSKEGTIWRIPHGGGIAQAWLHDAFIAPVTETIHEQGFLPVTLTVGPNGLEFWHGALYTSVSFRGTIVRIPVDANGRAGTPQVIFHHLYADDFAFDDRGDLYAAASREGPLATEVARITPNGTYTPLATVADGVDMPSAVAFGICRGNRENLYITNLAIFTIQHHPSLEVLSLEYSEG